IETKKEELIEAEVKEVPIVPAEVKEVPAEVKEVPAEVKEVPAEVKEVPEICTFKGIRRVVMKRVWAEADQLELEGKPMLIGDFGKLVTEKWAEVKKEVPTVCKLESDIFTADPSKVPSEKQSEKEKSKEEIKKEFDETVSSCETVACLEKKIVELKKQREQLDEPSTEASADPSEKDSVD
ncbi:unnamed protein product, partial [marine sediment metagenome]